MRTKKDYTVLHLFVLLTFTCLHFYVRGVERKRNSLKRKDH